MENKEQRLNFITRKEKEAGPKKLSITARIRGVQGKIQEKAYLTMMTYGTHEIIEEEDGSFTIQFKTGGGSERDKHIGNVLKLVADYKTPVTAIIPNEKPIKITPEQAHEITMDIIKKFSK